MKRKMKKLLATIALSTSVDVRDRLKTATLRMRTCGLTALIGLCVAHLPAKAAEFISRDELRADITQTYELLRSHHPNLSAHTGRKDFDDLYKRLLDDVGESNSQDEAFFAIAELVASVCDEHTRVITGKADRILLPDGWPWYEFPLIVDDGRLFMEEFQTGKTEEVISINGIAGQDIVSALAARSPNDGCLGDATLIVNEALPIYGSLMGKLIGYDGPYKVRSKSPDSQTVTERTVRAAGHFVSTTHRSQFHKQQDRVMRTGLLVDGFRQRHLGFAVGEAGLDYRYSERHNAAYLGVDSFKTPEKAKKGVELVMRDIIKKNPDRLIIDLVDNSGGATKTARQLLAFLLPRSHRLHHKVRVKNVKKQRPENFEYFDDEAKDLHQYNARFFGKIRPKQGVRTAPIRKQSFGKPDYKGKITVLISPTSRSNSIRVAANLKRLRDATIVGGAPATHTVTYCARGHGDFTLDHTGFVLNIPENCYDSPENRFNDQRTLEPDIEVDVLDGPLAGLNFRIIEAAVDDHQKVATN